MNNDPRRAILINGAAYRRQASVASGDTGFFQTLCSALALAVFVVGGLMMIVALSA